MLPNDYQHYALRTVNPELAFWEEIYASDEWKQQRRLLAANAALGMCGENVEIQAEPTADECGDGLWYAAVMCRVLGYKMHDLIYSYHDLMYPTYVATSPGEAERFMTKGSGIVAELVKKYAFHGKDLYYQVSLQDSLGPESDPLSDAEFDLLIEGLNNEQLDDSLLLYDQIVHGLKLYVAGVKYISPSDLESTMQQNIDKLKARWPDGFIT